MLPLENTFSMYPFYPQYNFSMFPPCFYYPTAINQAQPAAIVPLDIIKPSKQINPPKVHATTSESSAEASGQCKRQENGKQKKNPAQLAPNSIQNNKSLENLSKIKNWHQKQGRNANSNLLRMFFRRLQQRLQAHPELIQKIIRKNHLKIKPAKFLEWLELNDVQHRNYVRLPDMKALFAGKRGSREQAKIMRALLKDFLKNQATLCYLTSKKIKRESMPYNFYSVRNVLADIYNTKG